MKAVLVACLLATAASAQLYERALGERDLERVLPVLKADALAADERARDAAARQAEERARAEAVQRAAGEIARGADPYEWLRVRSSSVAAPSTAVYDAACSRALTAASGPPSAVLSFGIEAPSGWLTVWSQRDPAAIPPGTPNLPRQPAPAPAATRGDALVRQTRAFYAGRAFEYHGEPAPFEWQYLAPDKRVSATVMGVNVLGRLEPCRSLANGPLVVLRAEVEMIGPAAKAAEATPDGPRAERAFDLALEKAGLSQADYLNLKLHLLAARADAGAEDAGRPINGKDGAETAIRRRNAQVYREHREQLEPLLVRLAR